MRICHVVICYVIQFTHEQILANQNATELMKTTYILTCILFAISGQRAKMINSEEGNAHVLQIIVKAIRSKRFCLFAQTRNKYNKLCNILYYFELKEGLFS